MALLESLEYLSLLESSNISPLQSQSLIRKVPEKVLAAKIDGVHTDFAVCEFQDRVFIVITQIGKIATLVSVTRDPIRSVEEESGDTFTVKTVFGSECDEKSHLIARFVYEHTSIIKPALFALGLKDFTPRTIRAVRDVLNIHKTW